MPQQGRPFLRIVHASDLHICEEPFNPRTSYLQRPPPLFEGAAGHLPKALGYFAEFVNELTPRQRRRSSHSGVEGELLSPTLRAKQKRNARRRQSEQSRDQELSPVLVVISGDLTAAGLPNECRLALGIIDGSAKNNLALDAIGGLIARPMPENSELTVADAVLVRDVLPANSLVAICGNHDHFDGNVLARCFGQSGMHGRASLVGQPFVQPISLGGDRHLLVLSIDSDGETWCPGTRPRGGEAMDRLLANGTLHNQLDDFAKRLREAYPQLAPFRGSPAVMLVHHSCDDGYRHLLAVGDKDRQSLAEFCDEFGISCVLSGHLHKAGRVGLDRFHPNPSRRKVARKTIEFRAPSATQNYMVKPIVNQVAIAQSVRDLKPRRFGSFNALAKKSAAIVYPMFLRHIGALPQAKRTQLAARLLQATGYEPRDLRHNGLLMHELRDAGDALRWRTTPRYLALSGSRSEPPRLKFEPKSANTTPELDRELADLGDFRPTDYSARTFTPQPNPQPKVV